MTQLCGKWFGNFFYRDTLTIWLSEATPGRNKNLCSYKNLHMNVYKSSIHICPNLETTPVSFHRWMDKQTVVQPYNGLPLSNKNEWTIDTHNLNEFPGNYAEWKSQKITPCMIPFHIIQIWAASSWRSSFSLCNSWLPKFL